VVTQARSDNTAKQRRVLHERALAAARRGEWEMALAMNQELLTLDPDTAEVHNRIGKALSALGRYQEAHAAYTRASELDPHNIIAQRNLRRLDGLKETTVEEPGPHVVAPSYTFIEETGKTAMVSLASPTDRPVRTAMMPGDVVELRPDMEARTVTVYNSAGEYLGEIEPRIGERLVELMQGGNHYVGAVLLHEEDTLRVILHEVYQDPAQSDKLSFPTRVRGTAPRAYIRKDILFDAEETDLLVDEEDEEAETEEAEEETEMEDEEFSDDDMEENNL
jgi:tetratricopeptide (TPR) repeat protein